MNTTTAKCGHAIPAVGSPGSKARMRCERAPCETCAENDPLKQAIKAMPTCMIDIYDPHAHTTIEELAWTALVELDLIEEGQDGTEPKDAKRIRKWLAKWHPETLAKK